MSKRNGNGRGGPDFNRRDFLRGSGAAMAATAMATSADETQAQQNSLRRRRIVAGPTEITLNVNGEDHTVTVYPRTTSSHTRSPRKAQLFAPLRRGSACVKKQSDGSDQRSKATTDIGP